MQAKMLDQMKGALGKKLEEFDSKSKTLATENHKFEQGKLNMLQSLQQSNQLKKFVQSKLENARTKLEETQHEHIALQREKEETEANLAKI